MTVNDNVQIILNFGNGNLDVSGFLLAKTLQIRDVLCNDKYGSAMNSASFTLIKDDAFYNLLRDSEDDVSVLIVDGSGNVLFRGVLDPVFSDSWREPGEPGKIQLEAVDFSSKLDVAIQESFSWPAAVGDEPYRIFRRSEPERSILFLLLRMAGMQDLISPYAPDIDIAIKQFTLNANSSSVMAEIDTLLIEYGWCLNTLPDGTFTWLQTAKDKLSEIPVIGPKDILADGSFKVEKKYDVHDGVCVIWPKTKIFEDTIVYRGNLPVGDTSDPTPGEAIAAGDYWPEDSDINEVWMDFGGSFLDLPYLSGSTRSKNSDIDIISSSGWYIKDIKDPGIKIDPITTEHPVIYEPLRARLRYRNTSDVPKKLRWTEIWAKALVRDQLVRSFYPESADDPDEYKARFIYDDVSAERLARIRWMRLYSGCWKISFRSSVRLEPGNFLHLDQAGRFSGNVLITSRTRTYDFSGLYTYTAVTTEPVSNVSIRRTASGSSGRPRLSVDGKSSYLHIAYSDSADGSQGFSTTDAAGKLYIGQCTDFSPSAPLDPSLYTWSRFKGRMDSREAKETPGKTVRG